MIAIWMNINHMAKSLFQKMNVNNIPNICVTMAQSNGILKSKRILLSMLVANMENMVIPT